jgi:hypothetical protein
MPNSTSMDFYAFVFPAVIARSQNLFLATKQSINKAELGFQVGYFKQNLCCGLLRKIKILLAMTKKIELCKGF